MRALQQPTADWAGDDEVNSAERVATQLRQSILQGKIRPGEKLKDAHLAAQYGVSRNTMREAIRDLSGLVVTRRHNGTRVKVLTVEDVRDIYRVRRTLEDRAIAGSSAATDEQLRKIRIYVDESTLNLERKAWDSVNTSSAYYHQAIVQMLGSERIDAFFENVLAQLRLCFGMIPIEEEFHSKWVIWDQKIAGLIMSGQREEAAREMAAYLEESEAQMIDIIRGSAAPAVI